MDTIGRAGTMVTSEPVRVRRAQRRDAAAIAEIYNQGIIERVATFEDEPRTVEAMIRWVNEHGQRFPALVGVVGDAVVGWASVSEYRPRPCYAGIGEFSIYIDERWRGRGVGRVLLPALIDAAERAGFWKLVPRVFPFNTGSRRLCAASGFREVGAYEKHAQLDGEWLDVIIVERLIPANQPE